MGKSYTIQTVQQACRRSGSEGETGDPAYCGAISCVLGRHHVKVDDSQPYPSGLCMITLQYYTAIDRISSGFIQGRRYIHHATTLIWTALSQHTALLLCLCVTAGCPRKNSTLCSSAATAVPDCTATTVSITVVVTFFSCLCSDVLRSSNTTNQRSVSGSACFDTHHDLAQRLKCSHGFRASTTAPRSRRGERGILQKKRQWSRASQETTSYQVASQICISFV